MGLSTYVMHLIGCSGITRNILGSMLSLVFFAQAN